MTKLGLFYGSKGGNTETVAKKILAKFEGFDIDYKCISEITAEELLNYDNLIFGVSTVGAETWDAANPTNTWDSLFAKMKDIDLSGKNFAIFGLGNQVQWPDHFIDDVKVVYDNLTKSGAVGYGKWPVEGYDHNESASQDGDHFLGLAVDEDFQDDQTEERVDAWVTQIKSEFGL